MRNEKIIGFIMGLLFMLPLSVLCQTRLISGTVSNSRGEPVPLASIQLKGTSIFAPASESGRFSINVSGDNPILVISSSGYTTQEIKIGTSDTYNIQLAETGILSEVVVTALGISKEKKALGLCNSGSEIRRIKP